LNLGSLGRPRKIVAHFTAYLEGAIHWLAFRGNQKTLHLVMRSQLRFARINAFRTTRMGQLGREGKQMKGSITFRFGGTHNDYRVHISREGELDSGDLQAVAALLNEDIMLQRSIEAGRGQLRDTWSN
jgi:hypothetical protein